MQAVMRMAVRAPLLVLAALLALLPPAGLAGGQELPPGPTAAYQAGPLQAPAGSADFDEVLVLLLDFAPGAATPAHTHGGVAFVSVVEGELARQIGDSHQVYAAGEGWAEPLGEVHSAHNPGVVPARALVTFLLPPGAAPTTVAEGGAAGAAPPGPTVAYQSARVPVPQPAGGFDEARFALLDFAPGAATPRHTHGGLTVVAVIDGELTRRIGDDARTFGPGEVWLEPAGEVHSAHNESGQAASVAVAFLLPQGAATTTAVAEPPTVRPQVPRAQVPAGR